MSIGLDNSPEILAELDDELPGRIAVRTSYRYKDLVKTIPGARWNNSHSVWTVPLGWAGCLAIRGVFGNNLDIGPNLTQWAYNELSNRVNPSIALRDVVDIADVTSSSDIIDIATSPVFDPLFTYQKAGAAFLATARQALLADEQGSGKTAMAIFAVRILSALHDKDPDNYPDPFPVLIVAPNSVKFSWQREFAQWWPDVDVQVINGTAAKRRKQFEAEADVFVINWESVRTHSRLAPYGSIALKRCTECGGDSQTVKTTQCEAHLKELNHIDFGTVVADECFTSDVFVSTPQGRRSIADLSVGDEVYGYDHATDRIMVSQVLDTMSRPSRCVLPGSNSTPNHPYYVVDEGYRPAGDLMQYDIVYEIVETGLPSVRRTVFSEKDAGRVLFSSLLQHSARQTIEDMLALSTRILGGRKPKSEALFKKMLKSKSIYTAPKDIQNLSNMWTGIYGMAMPTEEVLFSDMCESSSTNSRSTTHTMRELRCDFPTEESLSQILFEELSFAISMAGSGTPCDAEGKTSETARRRTVSEKFTDVYTFRTKSIQNIFGGATYSVREKILAEGGFKHREEIPEHSGTGTTSECATRWTDGDGYLVRRNGTTEMCDAGPSLDGSESSGGSRWRGASVSGSEGARRSSGSASSESRVVRHQILELRDSEQYRRMCSLGAQRIAGKGTRSVPVYSITTSSGNYFADGILVRNCHRSKDPATKQSRAMIATTGDAPYRFALSGTPIANHPGEFWSILHWLNPAEWPTRTQFVDRYCLVSFNVFGGADIIGLKPDRETEFFKAVDPRMRRMTKKVILPFLPPIVRQRRDVYMEAKQAKAYEEMRDKMIAWLESDEYDSESELPGEDADLLVASTPLTQSLRLMQFASAYGTIDAEDNMLLSDPSCKISAFMDDLPDFGDDSIIVFAESRKLIELLATKLDKAKIPYGLITGKIDTEQRLRNVDDFQAGRVKLILCTIKAGGTGLTLTKGRVMVFLQRSWSMVDQLQAEARGHRIGSEQHENVLIVDYVTADTIEEAQIWALKTKESRMEEIVRDKELWLKALKGQLPTG